jgi:hypothetical protein
MLKDGEEENIRNIEKLNRNETGKLYYVTGLQKV